MVNGLMIRFMGWLLAMIVLGATKIFQLPGVMA
jgi:hypothetical protein